MAGTVFTGPYDAGVGAFLNEARWNQLIRALTAPGVVANILNSFAITLTGALTFDVDTGEAIVEGTLVRLEGGKKSFTVSPLEANPRKDRVVVQVDRTANTSDLVYKKGVAAGSPSPPALTQTADGTGVYEIPLFILNVPATAGSITSTDERRYAAAPVANISTAALRPTAAQAGARVLWFTTDDGVLALSDGSTWTTLNGRNVYVDGSLIANRTGLNFVTGSGLQFSGTDNPGAARVDISISDVEKFLFGDSGDSTGIGGLTTISGTTTATSDVYAGNLTVNGTLIMAGYRLFVWGTLTLGPGAVIKNDGGNASTTTAGTGAPAGTCGGGALGGGGTSNGSGSNPGLGGPGGGGSSGATGGAITAPTTANGGGQIAHDLFSIIRCRDLGANLLKGGGGGGGGGVSGGGGGGGGGVLIILAQAIVVSSGSATIQAKGGNGDVAAGLGGGGGGGGFVLVVSRTATGNAWPTGLSLLATGGTAFPSGVAGTAGPTIYVNPTGAKFT